MARFAQSVLGVALLAAAAALPGAAAATTVNLGDLALPDRTRIADADPTFGSSGPVALDWAPFNDARDLLFWSGDYSGGPAAYCTAGAGCALDLKVNGALNAVQLDSFFLGGWPNTSRQIAYSVVDLATGTTVLSATASVDGATGQTVAVNATSSGGFRILFGPDGFNGGVNNVTYFGIIGDPPLGVPGPAGLGLFGAGLLGLAGAALRRRA